MRRRLLRFAPLAAIACLGPGPVRAEGPSYHGEVEPIVRRHCQECHRPGQVAPFSLLTYEQVRKRADDIATVTEARTMPPWHASTTEGGPFRDVRVLSEGEIKTLADWVEAGCPEGDRSKAPPPRTFASDWALGEPDLVLTMPEPYELAAEGKDELRVFVVPTGLAEGRWVAAVDFRPGNRKVVHHVLAAFDATGAARKRDAADPKPGYASLAGFGLPPTAMLAGIARAQVGGLGGWAPGKAPHPLPEGVGRYIPSGADILIQAHYHRSGKVERDATSIGLYFAKTPIDKVVHPGAVVPPRRSILARPDLHIPAGDPAYEVRGSLTVRDDSHLFAIVPHMHWLGKDFRLDAIPPDGTSRTLIRVDRWDFNWQDTYEFREPVALPRGTRIELIAHFDNSAANPANPSKPPVAVGWGEQTTDEMCIGFLQMTRDAEHLGNRPPGRSPLPAGLDREGGLNRPK
ncbi:MAG TPA: ascorbate-dependent monooxygenase [Isosphaeraceae bacterium]|jgi:hypothetical protein|nr:ascorbate-dependent monooxygenase [Isosphaeraceae bacterium]